MDVSGGGYYWGGFTFDHDEEVKSSVVFLVQKFVNTCMTDKDYLVSEYISR